MGRREEAEEAVKGSKRHGPQDCDCCGREFVVRYEGPNSDIIWICPYCGFNNKQATARMGMKRKVKP